MIVRGCDFPEDRCYHPDYNVWAKQEPGGDVVIGATSFGVALAVDFIAFLPKPLGTTVEAGRAVGLLELAKTIVSVRTPVKGTILAVNEGAVADPGIIRDDPYRAGWLIRLKAEDWESAQHSLVAGAAIAPAFEEAMDLDNFEGPGKK
jgi:glycine cleavage system H protein